MFIISHDLLLCIEILETLSSSSSIPVMTTTLTTTQFTNTVSTTVSQQFTRSTTVHHTSSVSSVRPTTTSVNSITQLSRPQLRQGVLMDKLHNTYIINNKMITN